MNRLWKYKVSLISIIAIFVALFSLNYYYKIFVFHSRHKLNYSGDVAVMTYNVDAYYPERFLVDRQNRLLSIVKSAMPNILCFQELSFESLNMITSQLDGILGTCEELNVYDKLRMSRLYSPLCTRNFKRYKCIGDIITDDMTDDERAMFQQSQKQMNVVSAEFKMGPDKWVTVFSAHLYSSAYSTARRSMDKDDSWFKGLSLYWRNYKIGKRIRDYEAENLRRFIDEVRKEGKPVILAGDLNDWCGSNCLKILMGEDLKDAWSARGRGFGWTYFGWNLRLRLDHILYSEELELADVSVIDSDLSDHKPLMARFRMK